MQHFKLVLTHVFTLFKVFLCVMCINTCFKFADLKKCNYSTVKNRKKKKNLANFMKLPQIMQKFEFNLQLILNWSNIIESNQLKMMFATFFWHLIVLSWSGENRSFCVTFLVYLCLFICIIVIFFKCFLFLRIYLDKNSFF